MQTLIDVAKANRYGHRDATMILVAYRHGFRASELTDLRWDQIQFSSANLHVRRVKQGTPSTHPLLGMNYVRYASFSENSNRNRRLCLRRSAAAHSPQRDSRG